MRLIDADALKKTLGDWIIAHYTDTFTGDDAGLVFAHLINRTETIDKVEKEMNFDEKEEQNMAQNIIGERIAGLLREQGKTQRELAEQVGTTEVSMYRYIKGDRVPKGPILANIAKALHTTTDYLLGNEKDSNDPELEITKPMESKWTPCTKRLPEKSGRYLVTRGSNVCGSLWDKVDILNYSDLMGLKKEKIWWSGNVGKSDFEKFDDVIAWQPLPEPYKIFTENEKVCNGCHYNDGGVHAECIVCDKEHDEKILNDAEKKYLSAVIKPFRDRVEFIYKVNSLERYGFQCIDIRFTDESIDMELPIFESGTMYKGMELGKEYTLEELGI